MTESELPKIGKPATRALAAVGVTRLSQLRKFTESELLELHGTGPKAIRILREELAAAIGATFKADKAESVPEKPSKKPAAKKPTRRRVNASA